MKPNVEQAKNSDSATQLYKRFCDAAFKVSRSIYNHGDPEKRTEAASLLLHSALRLSDPPLAGGQVESWNVAEPVDRNFENTVPILFLPSSEAILLFYFSVLLFRSAFQPGKTSTMRPRAPDKLAWGHFLMSDTPQKLILHVDIAGTDRMTMPAEVLSADGNRMLQVRLSKELLSGLRAKHETAIGSLVRRSRECVASLLKTAKCSSPPELQPYRKVAFSDVLEVQQSGALPLSEEKATLLLADIEKSPCFPYLLDRLTNALNTTNERDWTAAFVRQMLVQAVICPDVGLIETVGFIPDLSYRNPTTDKDISSAALQVFLSSRLPCDHPLWKAWATLVTLSGREKSVHDFSRRAEQIAIPKGEFVPGHEMNSPVGLLYEEYRNLSPEGRVPS